jgi:hypothetical protein
MRVPLLWLQTRAHLCCTVAKTLMAKNYLRATACIILKCIKFFQEIAQLLRFSKSFSNIFTLSTRNPLNSININNTVVLKSFERCFVPAVTKSKLIMPHNGSKEIERFG